MSNLRSPYLKTCATTGCHNLVTIKRGRFCSKCWHESRERVRTQHIAKLRQVLWSHLSDEGSNDKALEKITTFEAQYRTYLGCDVVVTNARNWVQSDQWQQTHGGAL